MRGAVLVALAAVALAAAGWLATDRLQARDDFCVSCHVRDRRGTRVPLHTRLLRDFRRRPPGNLAAAHAAAAEAPFGCYDCHDGQGALGRARFKAVAAFDTVLWATGTAREPRAMRFPLRDADCAGCHAARDAGAALGGLPRFHAEPAHTAPDSEAETGCVDCHPAHLAAPAADGFLDETRVRRRCATCHSGLRERQARRGTPYGRDGPASIRRSQ